MMANDPDGPVLHLETDEEPLLEKQMIALAKQWLRKAVYQCQPGKHEVYIEQGECPLCGGDLLIRVGGSHVHRDNPRRCCLGWSVSCQTCKSYMHLEAPCNGSKPKREDVHRILAANVSVESVRKHGEEIKVITTSGDEFFVVQT